MAETIKLVVNGMTCDHCVRAVTGALEDVAGVQSAVVSLEENSAQISGEGIDVAALLKAIEEEGYEATVPA